MLCVIWRKKISWFPMKTILKYFSVLVGYVNDLERKGHKWHKGSILRLLLILINEYTNIFFLKTIKMALMTFFPLSHSCVHPTTLCLAEKNKIQKSCASNKVLKKVASFCQSALWSQCHINKCVVNDTRDSTPLIPPSARQQPSSARWAKVI